MKVSATRRVVGGVPTLMAGPRPLHAPIFCLFYDQALRESVVRPLYMSGIRAFAVRSMVGVGKSAQTDESLRKTVARLEAVARFAPEANLIADCFFFPSEEWMLSHPHEGFYTAGGQILVMGKESLTEGKWRRRDYIKVPGPDIASAKGKKIGGEDPRILYGRRRVSPFSKLFASEAAKSVRRLIGGLHKAGLGDKLWGVFLECYICGEWNLGMYSPDHGRAAILGFRSFLRNKYGSDRALRLAWNDPAVSLSTALPPREYDRIKGNGFWLMSQRSLDYREAEAFNLSEQFLAMARAVKGCDRRLGTGGFQPGINAPQSECRRIYSDPAVDFAATPLAYDNCGTGYGVNSQSTFCDGLFPIGKVWLDELDTRTHMASPVTYTACRAKTPGESLEQLWRAAGQMLVRGHHGWWLDFGGAIRHFLDMEGAPPYSWHLAPEILGFHRQFSKIWSNLAGLDRRPRGDIKVFISSSAARSHEVAGLIGMQRHTEWTFAGASVEYDILENLLSGQGRLGKINIFPHSQLMESDQLRQLRLLTAKSNAWFVWMNSPALCSPDRVPDARRSESLTGFPVRLAELATPTALDGRVTPEGASFLGLRRDSAIGQSGRKADSGWTNGIVIGKPFPEILFPVRAVIAEEKSIVPLARFSDNGAIAAALRHTKSGGGHVAYNLPVLNSFFLRALARRAGCHVFADRDDFICASRGLLLLHTAYSGTHALRIPNGARLYDLRAQSPVRTRGNKLMLKLKRGMTRLYRMD